MKKTVLALALVATTGAFANVKGGKIGMNFQYGSNISSLGVWWHVIDMLAINPYIGYSSSTTKYTNITGGNGIGCGATAHCTRTDSSSTLVFGIDIPIYLVKFSAVDLFVAPAFSYSSKSTSDKYENANNGQSIETKGTNPTYNFGLYLGLQIPILDQLHVFGKGGFEYSITPYENPGTGSTNGNPDKTTTFSTTRYSVGAIFYFN